MFFNEYFVQQKKAAPKKEKENYYLLVQSLNLVQVDVFGRGSTAAKIYCNFSRGLPSSKETLSPGAIEFALNQPRGTSRA